LQKIFLPCATVVLIATDLVEESLKTQTIALRVDLRKLGTARKKVTVRSEVLALRRNTEAFAAKLQSNSVALATKFV
jgi:hypothetical protein